MLFRSYANISVVFGTAVYLLGLGAAYFTVGVSLTSASVLASLTEFSILVFRIAVIIRHRQILKDGAV